jgi:hypothetical protein
MSKIYTGEKYLMGNTILRDIRRYARTKAILVFGGCGMTLIGMLVFLVLVMLTPLLNVKYDIAITISAILSALGLVIAILFLVISEGIRKRLINNFNNNVLILYLDYFCMKNHRKFITYYEIEDIFFFALWQYCNKKKVNLNRFEYISKSLFDLITFIDKNNVLRRNDYLFREANSSTLFDIYSNYRTLIKNENIPYETKCNEIELKYKSDQEYAHDNYIPYEHIPTKIEKFIAFSKDKRSVRKLKVFLIIICLIFFAIPKYNSWIFNLVTILLLSIDVAGYEKEDSSKVGI